MDYTTQNKKIEQITEETIVIGIDIGSETNFARAFDWRGREITKKVYKFNNSREGFIFFDGWMTDLLHRTAKMQIIVGCEPTGHYWFPLAGHLKDMGILLVTVNPYHVKQTKEIDDNSPTKTDQKDPKTIAKLVIGGNYGVPYIPEGIYADLREAVSSRDRIVKALNAAANRIQRWLKIYYPEYLGVYKKFDSASGLMVLEAAPLPEDVIALGIDGVVKIWRAAKMRAVGRKRAMTLVESAHNSIGIKGGACARLELQMLLEDYKTKKRQLEMIEEILEKETMKVPNVEKLLAIKGIGIITIAGFIAEVGDIRRFDSPKQIQKLAGFELKKNSSGKHKGQTTISKRGRRRLRRILFQAVLPLMKSNPEFREVYEYYTNRLKNPLKGKQAMIAVSCKLIRVFYTLLSKGVDYDAARLRSDIIRPTMLKAAA